jgi:thiamine-phosphate pyrophosphorylase
MRGLYAIVDVEALALRGHEPVAFAERVLAARPAALQVRDKRGGARRALELLRALAPRARAANVPLFANDRPDLALLASCGGVHLGQDDVPPALARGLAERAGAALAIGLSTHDEAQVEFALASPEGELSYLAIGPIFATTSKENPDPVLGIDGLRALAARVRRARPGLPIVGIGGVTLERARAVGAIVDAVAVIGALVPADLAEVTARAAALGAAILGETW